MLVQQANELVDLVDRTRRLKATANEQQAFDSRRRNIQDLVDALSPHILALESLRTRGISTPDISVRVESIRSAIDAVRSGFRDDPQWIIDPRGFSFNAFSYRVTASSI